MCCVYCAFTNIGNLLSFVVQNDKVFSRSTLGKLRKKLKKVGNHQKLIYFRLLIDKSYAIYDGIIPTKNLVCVKRYRKFD